MGSSDGCEYGLAQKATASRCEAMAEQAFVIDHPEVLAEPKRVEPPFSWVGHIPFAIHLVKLLRPSILVELGVHTGNSFFAFCQGVMLANSPTRCIGVDTWRGDEHAGFYDDSVYEAVRHHAEDAYPFATLLRMTFDEALAKIDDRSVDLLHVDGLHTYEAVRHDFESWLPKLSDRAVVLFHDITVRSEDFGVWKLWDELKEKYLTFEFHHSFGLGVVCVGKALPEETRSALARACRDERPLFERLGYTACAVAESRASGVPLDSPTGTHELRKYIQRLENRLETSGVRLAYELSLTPVVDGHPVEMRKAAREVLGDELAVAFDLQAWGDESVGSCVFVPLNAPVGARLKKVRLTAADGSTAPGAIESTNSSFEYEGTHFFVKGGAEIRLTFPEGVYRRVEIEYDTIVYGPQLYHLLFEQFAKTYHNIVTNKDELFKRLEAHHAGVIGEKEREIEMLREELARKTKIRSAG